jgi:pyruvate dehydrogenase E2 component (dihydrolipoamide acetyltransferase)
MAPAPARIPASPAARKRARERGIDLGDVGGSGPRGRIVLADLERAPAMREEHPEPERRRPQVSAPTAPAPVARRRRPLPPRVELRDETIPLSPMRRALARNLAAAKPGAPHFYLETSADARRLVALREQLEELEQGPVSVNDVIVKATAEALSRHPEVNAAWGADAIVRRGSVDVGIAVALDDGLVTPVVRDADAKSVFEIAAEVRELAGRAREKRLRPEEYQGASFTISNLGMFGVEAFYAVINPPEAAILAVGAVQKVPWVDEGTGQLVAMERVRLGLSCDHRVVDGATGARFLQTLKAILESPVRLVVT